MARVGIDASLTFGSTVGDGVKDLNIECSRTEIPINSRGFDWVRYLLGQKELPLDFDIEADAAACPSIKAAFDGGTEISVTFSDGAETSPETWTADFLVTKYSQAAPVNGEYVRSVSMRLSALSGATLPS